MRLKAIVGSAPAPEPVRAWLEERLHEALGAVLVGSMMISVVVTPPTRAQVRTRCAVVVSGAGTRRVVEASDRRSKDAVMRAFRLLALSLERPASSPDGVQSPRSVPPEIT